MRLKNNAMSTIESEKMPASENDTIFRAIFENSLDAILITYPDGRIFSANPSACAMFGRTEDNLIALGRNGLVNPSDPRLSVLLSERDKNSKAIGELEMLRNDGTVFQTEISSSLFNTISGQPRTVMIIRDITVRKQEAKALHVIEQNYRNLLDNSLVGISRSQDDGRLIYANKAYANMYGYSSPEEMMTKVPNVSRLFVNPEDRKVVKQILNEKGIMIPREFELLKYDGTHFFGLVSARKIQDTSGNLICLQAEHIDISESKRAIEKLKKS
jgi:PAS domain S-box-containing protein